MEGFVLAHSEEARVGGDRGAVSVARQHADDHLEGQSVMPVDLARAVDLALGSRGLRRRCTGEARP